MIVSNPNDLGARGLTVGDVGWLDAVLLSTDAGGRGVIQIKAQGVQKVNIASSGDSYLNGGNFGVNNSSPLEKVDVIGNIKLSGIHILGQYTTATEPAYVKGAQYFNTTLNKMRIGGATVYETVTSS